MPTTPQTSSLSSPTKAGPNAFNQTTSSAGAYLKNTCAANQVALEGFLNEYLSTAPNAVPTPSGNYRSLVRRIKETKSGSEETLYTGRAPLLCLLNAMSQEVYNSLSSDQRSSALIFRTCHHRQIQNPFSISKPLKPDIVMLKETAGAFSGLTGEYLLMCEGSSLTGVT